MGFKFCIDAGHYGKYNQSPVVPAYYESVMNWKLSQYQKQYLNEYEDVTVVMTRSSQAKDMELIARGKKAKGANLFISNHSNAAGSESANYALAIVMRENSSTEYDEVSKNAGKRLVGVIGKVMGVESKTITKEYNGDRDGNGKNDDEYYGVLQGCKMVGAPGVILEHGFHTNTATANWLLKDANLQKLASAEVEEIAKIFDLKKKKTVASTTNAAVSDASIKAKKGHIRVIYKGSDGLNIRTAPSMDSKVSKVLKYNAVDNVVGITADGNWYKTVDGLYVSASSGYVTFVDFTTYRVKVEVTDLNMRTSAGVGNASKGKIAPGVYTIVAEKKAAIDSKGTKGVWGQLAGNGYWIALKYTEKK